MIRAAALKTYTVNERTLCIRQKQPVFTTDPPRRDTALKMARIYAMNLFNLRDRRIILGIRRRHGRKYGPCAVMFRCCATVPPPVTDCMFSQY